MPLYQPPAAAGGSGAVSTDTIWDAKGDVVAGTGADTAGRLAVGSNGRVLIADSAQTTGLKWGGGVMFARRLMGADLGNANSTFNLNSTSYVAPGALQFIMDWDVYPATHFLIAMLAFANEGSQTVTAQLAEAASPGTSYSSGGNDLSIPNNAGAVGSVNSGWVAVNGTPSGLKVMVLALKGSTATVDLTGRWVDIMFKAV